MVFGVVSYSVRCKILLLKKNKFRCYETYRQQQLAVRSLSLVAKQQLHWGCEKSYISNRRDISVVAASTVHKACLTASFSPVSLIHRPVVLSALCVGFSFLVFAPGNFFHYNMLQSLVSVFKFNVQKTRSVSMILIWMEPRNIETEDRPLRLLSLGMFLESTKSTNAYAA